MSRSKIEKIVIGVVILWLIGYCLNNNINHNENVIAVVVIALGVAIPSLIAKSLARPHGKAVTHAEAEQYNGQPLPFFVEQTEKVLAVLGGGYLKNMLTGAGVKNGISVVSDKRVYFKGTCYYTQKNRWKKSQEERIVDLKDVTATGMVHSKDWGVLLLLPVIVVISALIFAISIKSTGYFGSLIGVVLIGLLICVFIGVIAYCIFSRMVLFEISFAGGKIGFNTAWYAAQEVEEFQKQLRQAKDRAIREQAPVQTNSVVVSSPEPSTEVLSKYAELLESGHITQDEYNALKKKHLEQEGISLGQA